MKKLLALICLLVVFCPESGHAQQFTKMATSAGTPSSCSPLAWLTNDTTNHILYFGDSTGVCHATNAGGSAVAGGSNTQLQYNASGSLGGMSKWTTNGTTTLTGIATAYFDISAGNMKTPEAAGFTATTTNRFGLDTTSGRLHHWDTALASDQTITDQADLSLYQLLSDKDSPNGYAGLDVGTLLLASEFPTPTVSTFGGVKDKVAVANSYGTSIVNGVLVVARPVLGDLNGGTAAAALFDWSSSTWKIPQTCTAATATNQLCENTANDNLFYWGVNGAASIRLAKYTDIPTISGSGIVNANGDGTYTAASNGNPTVSTNVLTRTEVSNGSTQYLVQKRTTVSGVSRVVDATTSDLTGLVGISQTLATAGNTSEVSVRGFGTCTFDGATTAGDYVQESATSAGNCHDAGATLPVINQVLGRVTTTNGAGGNFKVQLGTEDLGIQSQGNVATAQLGSATMTRRAGFTLGAVTGSALTTSDVTYFTFPVGCTVTAYDITLDAADSTIKFKVWKIADGTANPTSSNNISTSGWTVSTGTHIYSTTVSDLTTTTVAAKDIMAISVVTANTAKYANVGITGSCTI